MLEKINSKYILETIFSHVGEQKKLELIKYNKKIQNILDVNIINYRIFSGIDKIEDNDGKRKEYDCFGHLIFEGEYIDGKRNGKKKEYNHDGYLVFEGDYINVKKNGKCKEYYTCDRLKFEGEYINGKKNGKCKEYYENGKLKYEGIYLNGEKNGMGKEYYYSRDSFKFSLFSKEDDNNEENILFFEGEYLNDKKWNGKGFDKNGEIIFELKDGTGKCQEYNNNGKLIFEGEYLNGKGWDGIIYDDKQNIICKLIDGKGIMKEYNYNGKLIFEGEYINGDMRKGKVYNSKGKLIFEGEYKNGKKNGKGKEYFYKELGSFRESLFEEINEKEKDYGVGVGELIFEGEYLNGERWNGKGKEYCFELFNPYGNSSAGDYILKFEGEYLNGKRHGKGKEYNKSKKLIFEGEYLYNYRRKGKIYIDGEIEFIGEYLFNKKWSGKGYNYRYHRVYKEDGGIFQNISDRNESDKDDKVIYELKNGNGTVKEYDYNGKLVFEGEIKNGIKDGKVKEYHYNKRGLFLLFEGEYINGNRHGNGKEYNYSGKLVFEGEYLNGKKWNGIEKEYSNDDYNKLKFEIEYLNGKRNGKRKEYNNDGKLIFDGEYLNEKKWYGKGKEYYNNGTLKYEGIYLKGEKNGKGKEYYCSKIVFGNGLFNTINEKENDNNEESKLFFEGEYLNDKKWNGKGFDKSGAIIFELKDGTGKCQEYDNNGELIFEGEYKNGKRWNGKGKECTIFSNFEIEYLNGEIISKKTIHI